MSDSDPEYRVYAIKPGRFSAGHFPSILEEVPTGALPKIGESNRTDRWGQGNKGEGEAGLQRALLLPENEHVLRYLGGVPSQASHAWTMREAGGQGGVDLIALFEREHASSIVLFIDCKDSKPATLSDRLKQLAQGQRNAAEAIGNFAYRGEYKAKLVFLSGWHKSARKSPPRAETPMAVHLSDGLSTLEMEWWGYLTCIHDGQEFVLVGGLPLDQSLAKQVTVHRATNPESVLLFDDQCNELVLEFRPHEDAMQGRLRVSAEVHREALRVDSMERMNGDKPANRLARIRRAVYTDESGIPGWKFKGESNSKGFVRLNWLAEGYASEDSLKERLKGMAREHPLESG